MHSKKFETQVSNFEILISDLKGYKSKKLVNLEDYNNQFYVPLSRRSVAHDHKCFEVKENTIYLVHQLTEASQSSAYEISKKINQSKIEGSKAIVLLEYDAKMRECRKFTNPDNEATFSAAIKIDNDSLNQCRKLEKIIKELYNL